MILRRGATSTSTSLVAFSSLGSRLILTLFWSGAQSSWTGFLQQMFSTLPSQGIFMQMKSESFIYINHCIVLHQILHLIWNKCYEAIRRGRPRRPSGPIQLPWAQLTPSQQPLPRMRASGYQNTQFEGIFLGQDLISFQGPHDISYPLKTAKTQILLLSCSFDFVQPPAPLLSSMLKPIN